MLTLESPAQKEDATALPSIQAQMARLAAHGGPAEIQALQLVLQERLRQIEVEGFTPSHDDLHRREGQLAAAGACYLLAVHQQNYHFMKTGTMVVRASSTLPSWPFHRVLWKPTTARRMSTKGAALAVAELVRHIRAGLD